MAVLEMVRRTLASECAGATTVTKRTSSRLQIVRNGGKRADDADPAGFVQHQLDYAAERFHVEPQRCVRVSVPAKAHGPGQRGHRVQHVDHDRQFRLEPFMDRTRMRLEAVHVIGDGARALQQRAAFVGKARVARAAIE